MDIGIVYESFLSYGYRSTKCERCDDVKQGEMMDALFVCLGFSAPIYESGGIAVGYTVNYKAIEEYKEATGNEIKYGVFAVAKEKLGTSDIFVGKDTAVGGAICVEISQHGLAAFEIHITGFVDEYKDTKLAMGAYVEVTNGDYYEYSYMQTEEPIGNDKYHFVSYNDVVGK